MNEVFFNISAQADQETGAGHIPISTIFVIPSTPMNYPAGESPFRVLLEYYKCSKYRASFLTRRNPLF